jgi:protoheme IX farnesyltransferase
VAVHQPADALLAAWAIVGYALVYTPLKYRTPLALVIGAVPGAAPPLLGWTAVTGSIDAGGLALFAILLVWQMPHFLAITLFRQADFARAGIQCVPVVRGECVTRVQAVLWSMLLVPISLAPDRDRPHRLAVRRHRAAPQPRLPRPRLHRPRSPRRPRDVPLGARFFFASLFYLPALIAALVVDVLVL